MCCRCTLIGLLGPYRASSTMLATIVGRANGRSINVSTIRLPGKLSRTSTQATNSPNRPLRTATAIEISSVTLNEASAELDVTALTNAPHPPSADCHTMAANGSSTITDNQMLATPMRNGSSLKRLRERPTAVPDSPVGGTLSSGLSCEVGFSITVLIRSPLCRSW
ncbi:Uncharacterised protein [Mycobacteroides abscessus subsp. abscessus]|nr:Uncharacterised protein [Mycobacteroides abscessus subsp. abscessus]